MFEKIFDQVEQAKNDLSQNLMSYEKEVKRIKGEMDNSVNSFQDKIKANVLELSSGLDVIIQQKDKILKELIEEKDKKGLALLEEQTKNMSAVIDRKFQELRDDVEKFNVVTIPEIFTRVEEMAKIKAEQAFETDVEKIFEKYQERLAPLIFKCVLSQIFSFGKKKKLDV